MEKAFMFFVCKIYFLLYVILLNHMQSNIIVITGGSGFIGTKLTEELLSHGYSIRILLDKVPSRITNPSVSSIILDLMNDEIKSEYLEGVFGIINLAGVPIFGSWNKKYKDLIYQSRMKTTNSLVSAISKCTVKPQVLVSASAVGYYGNTGSNVITEESPAGNDFLAHVCTDWEHAAVSAEQYGVRAVTIRTANVIGPGGIMGVLVPLFKWHIGGYFGDGTQYMPWIDWRDIVGIYSYALDHDMHGPYNSSTGAVPQKDFMKTIARVMNKYPVWRIPVFAVKLLYGEFSSALTGGTNPSNKKISDVGYQFKVTDLAVSVVDSLKK